MNRFKTWIHFWIPVVILLMISTLVFAEAQNGKSVASLKKTTVLDAKLIDVNQIAAWISNDGLNLSDPTTGQSGFYFPKGAPADHAIIYTSGLWVIGKIAGDIRSAASDYATEFQPGMIKDNGTPDDPSDPRYKVYKFEAEDWDSPEMAADRAEAVAQGMEDKMYGDQMLYCVYNDWADHGGVWTKPPIGLEVRMTVFGFNRVGALGNTIFNKFVFINKGREVLHDAYVAQFFDPDLGQSNDDAVGCDTTLGIGYVYNIDGSDDIYGTEVPCFGCDFFQGPIVPSPGDTAFVPGQPPLIDHKMLQMTSFAPYINSGPVGMSDPSLASAQGAQMAYWFCSGLKGNGTEWLDPSQNNKVTRLPFAGDPVTGNGWIQQLTWPGADMRMSLAAGPFTLEKNVPYTVVVGYVVGVGKNNLNSIEIMRAYDRSAQTAYNLNFEIAKPAPYPVVKVGQLDQVLSLSWDATAKNYTAVDKVDVDSLGQPTIYAFQGFKLYQGESPSGPWTLIRQWDKDDGITKIWDYVFDPVSGEFIYSVVENGKDTGLAYSIVLDRDLLKNTPLINGKPYYYSLTTYSYNPFGIPRVLENAVKLITAIPQKPVLNTELSSKPADILSVTHTGPSDGSVVAKVIDPTKITGHDYQLTFKVNDEGVTVWDIKDVNAGWFVVNNQTLQASAAELATNEEFPIADGIQFKVSGPPTGLKDEGYNYVPAANRFLTAFNDANGAAPLWHMEGWAGLYGWADNFFGTSVPATGLKNVEIRFAACDELGNPLDPNDPNASMAYRYMRGVGATSTPAKPEFEPFIINKKGGYPYQDMRLVCFAAYDMETNPPRRLNVGFNENNTAAGLVNGLWMPGRFDTQGGMNATREFMFIFASDYSATPQALYTTNDMLNTVANVDLMYVGVPSRRGARLPQAGDKVILSANHINTPSDVFTISTAGFDKKASAEIAKKRLEDINVFPNPYFATNKAETGFFSQFVTFSSLPEKCIIRVFSLSGQMVRSISHTNGTPFEQWDLHNEQGLPVASGVYVVLVEVDGVGERVLKLAVVNREARYQHM